MTMKKHDVAIIGAGIVGLAHAWSAAKRGRSVLVCERSPRAFGASIRNFGMVWPIGQTGGECFETALRSRQLWLEAAAASGIWVEECGSLHLAYRRDEMDVLTEFADRADEFGFQCELVNPADVEKKSPAALRSGLLGGLWSSTELCVNPRQAIRALPKWLTESHDIEFRFETPIRLVETGQLETTTGERIAAETVVICAGDDVQTLFPDTLAGAGLRRCKLQMLRTVPQPEGWRLGPHLAGGLTLRHYRSFEHCESLPALQARIANESPELDRYGIHVMASQNDRGEVILGDSHEYDDAIEPFDKAEIDDLILRELNKMLDLPDWTIAERWSGTYVKHPTDVWFNTEPLPGVHIATATGGAGMTMSFGLSERFWKADGQRPAGCDPRA